MSVIEKEVILKALANPVFGREVFSKLPGSAFNGDETYKEFYMIIKNHYRTNTTPLGERTFLSLVEEKLTKQRATSEKMDGFFDSVHTLYDITREEGVEVIDEQINKFVKKTLSANLLRDTITQKNLDDEGVLEGLVEQLTQIAVLSGTGKGEDIIDFFEDIEAKREMYKNMRENRFSTGFDTLDKISGGGLARGELGMVIASSGGGKSTWAVQQTTNYVKRGMNVLYIILEEKLDRMLFKVEQNFLKIGKDEMFDELGELREDAFDFSQELYSKIPTMGKLLFSKHNPQEVTLAMLEQIIVNASIRKDIQLDAVIIDYPDLMVTDNALSESDAGGKLYEGIRGLAQKYNYVCWVLSQLNRSGYGQDIKTAENIEGSKRKLNAVELAVTMNQTNEEFKAGFLRLHIDKLRYSSGQPYDRIQHFKVERNGLIIRDETPEELNAHLALVGTDSYSNNSGDGLDKADKMIGNINNKLAGGAY